MPSITCGVLLATIAYTIMATVGVDYGLPGQVATRMAYGVRGAKWVPSFLRTIASTYWFAYQTVAGSLAVVAILDRWTGTPHSLITVSVTGGANFDEARLAARSCRCSRRGCGPVVNAPKPPSVKNERRPASIRAA